MRIEYVSDFADMLAKWTGAYISAVYSYAGFNTAEGRRLMYGKIVLEPFERSSDGKPFEFKTPHIFAGRFVKSITPNETQTIIDEAAAGKIREGLALMPKLGSSEQFSFYTTTDYHPLVTTLSVRGATKHEILNRTHLPRYLDWEMKVADVPFDTLDELIIHCGLSAGAMQKDGTLIEIVAKAPAEISRASTISAGAGHVECRVAKALDTSKVKLGYRIFKKRDDIFRTSAKGQTFEWSDGTDWNIGKHDVPVNDAPVMEAYLSYDDVPLDQSSVADPKKFLNFRHAIHRIFDEDVEILKQLLLAPEKNKKESFENAVANLFSLLGFSILHYGGVPKLQEGPDIVAVTPTNKILVVECTVGLPSQNDKIQKVSQRTVLLKEKLGEADYKSGEVLPVVATLLPRQQIAADLGVARDHRIAVLCKEELENALNEIRFSQDADQFFENLKKLIPPSEQDLFGRHMQLS